jgi:chromate transporter
MRQQQVNEPNPHDPSTGEVFLTFLHLGLTAFGGLAMVEPIRRRVVAKGWLSQGEFLDGVALCQVLPGATVVQLATYVGYRLRRVSGALGAAAGFILPAFGLMLLLSYLYFRFGDLPWVQSLSKGLGAVVIALLLQALWRLGQAVRRHWVDLIIALLTLAAFWGRVNYLFVILAAGLLRLLLTRWFPHGEHATHQSAATPTPALGLTLVQVAVVLAGLALVVGGLWRLSSEVGLMSLIFLKIGMISFGGGYVMIPILQWEMVDRLAWLTTRQFLDGILLGFITPAPLSSWPPCGFWWLTCRGRNRHCLHISATYPIIVFLTLIISASKKPASCTRLFRVSWLPGGDAGHGAASNGAVTLHDMPSWAIMAGQPGFDLLRNQPYLGGGCRRRFFSLALLNEQECLRYYG